MNVYDFSVKGLNKEEVSLSNYKGKVLLIVNSATGCGFTPQYDELQDIYENFKDRGFEILDFPCNQFGEQAPGTDEEIHSFCHLRYGITFPQFAKVEVRGEGAIPLYKWLSESSSFEGFGAGPMAIMMNGVAKRMDSDYRSNGEVKWNFTKFLIDRSGNIIARFEPTYSMKKVRAAIEKII